ncbi:MAG: sulfurtransferase [Anaerolineae bacterium]|nr:sulfurtransferase [Anaerolineae bacterium]MDW8173383.1 sulfurtransferase [Anaerolineae bacterium]
MSKSRWLGVLAALTLSIGAQGLVAGQTSAELPEVLVSADWVEQNLDNPQVRIIEVSVVPGVFERGHIPGAVNFVWHTDFVDTVRRDIVSAERFQELARAAGINQDTTVVLYGDNNNWFAAWGAWIFNVYGLTDARLLDGGRVKWEADGRALSTRATQYPQGNFTISQTNLGLRARLTDVLDVVEGRSPGVLVDIRSPKEYSGEIFAPEGVQELSVRAGHIPGAINVPWGKNVREDGTFKSVEELRALYAELGIDGAQPIITYCRIGERAALTWFVLHKLLGYEVSLYDGSWTEYGNVVGLPIENPSGTVWGGR